MPLVTISANINDALKSHEIVPEVVEQFTPKGMITVNYGDERVATLGNTLPVEDTQKRPDVHLAFAEADPEDSYTLVLTDPDAPKKGDKKWSEYAHFIVGGVRPKVEGGGAAKIDFSQAEEILPYMGPAPPEKTGKHRYIFLLYKETAGVPPKIKDRVNWGTGIPGSGAKDYAEKNGLVPVACNFFYAQNKVQ